MDLYHGGENVRKYKKHFLFTVLIVTMISIFGCQSKDKTEIVFRITWEAESGRGETIHEIVDLYNEQSDEYQVQMISGDEDKANILETLKNDSVDVFMMPYRYIKDNEVASELGTFIYSEESEALDKFYPSVIEMSKNQGELKGIPWIGHSMSLIYNVDLCEEAGVEPKQWTNIDDLVQGGLAITEATDAKGLGLIGADNHDSTWMVNQFIYSFGGELVELDENQNFVQVTINSEESVEALDFYKNKLGSLAQNGWEDDTGADVIESFGNEEIAFEIQGPWGITDVWKNGNTFEVGAIPLSQIGMYSEVGPIMLAMDKEVVEEEGIQDFISYLNTEEALNVLLTGEYEPKFQAYFPFRVPIMSDDSMDFYELYPEFISFTKGFEKPSINTPCPEWASDYEEKYQGILHDIFVENITIEQGLMGVAK